MEHISSKSQEEKERGRSGNRLAFDLPRLVAAALILFSISGPVFAQEEGAPPEKADAPADQDKDSQEHGALLEPETIGPTSTTLSEVSETETKLSGFGHKLVLNPYSGMPSLLIFSSVADKPAEVRALVTIDDRLLAVPLSFHLKTKSFVGRFPTPKSLLSYQFQVLLPDGKLAVSERFTADPRCEKNAADEVAKTAERFPSQAALLKEALVLDKESETLQYVINSIEAVLKEK